LRICQLAMQIDPEGLAPHTFSHGIIDGIDGILGEGRGCE